MHVYARSMVEFVDRKNNPVFKAEVFPQEADSQETWWTVRNTNFIKGTVIHRNFNDRDQAYAEFEKSCEDAQRLAEHLSTDRLLFGTRNDRGERRYERQDDTGRHPAGSVEEFKY